MWLAMVTGYASYLDRTSVLGFEVAEIFFVDLSGHVHHVASHFLFWLRVACKFQVRAICQVLRVTKTAFYTQRDLEVVHDFHEFFMRDVFGQHIIRFFGFIGGPCCGPCSGPSCPVAGPCCPVAGLCWAYAASVTTAEIKPIKASFLMLFFIGPLLP